MDARTLEALKASIAKWERNASGTLKNAKINSSSCPLCTLFLDGDRPICGGCPVSEKSGDIGCNGTPWVDANDAFWGRDERAFHAAARAEVAFLKSLLPSDEAAT